MTDVLAKICADKRQHIADRKAVRPLSEVRAAAEARNRTDPPRGFARPAGARGRAPAASA